MNNRIYLFIVGLALVGLALISNFKPKSDTIKIGILAPMQHKAMDQIVEGFKKEIAQDKGKKIKVDVQNASGDYLLMKAILDQFKLKQYDVVATIGSESTIAASKMNPNQFIIGLDVNRDAVSFDENRTAVLEPQYDPSLDFLKLLKPDLKKVSFVFSAKDKNFEMARSLKKRCQKLKIDLNEVMVDSLSDLYQLSSCISKNSDFILISKDHLAASGATTIAQTARALQIPFVSCDEGSVAAGASLAISNSEQEVGEMGAMLARRYLNENNHGDLSPMHIQSFKIFINQQAASEQGIDLSHIEEIAQKLNSQIVTVKKASK